MEQNNYTNIPRPIQFRIYKGARGKFGALRINLKKAYTDSSRDTGCVFLDMAPAVGPNVYDWDNNKIIMALSVTDISKIILFLRAPNHPIFKDSKLSLYHDKKAGSNEEGKYITKLDFIKYPDKDSFFVQGYQNSDGIEKKATTTVSPDEAVTIGTLLQAAIPQILAWN